MIQIIIVSLNELICNWWSQKPCTKATSYLSLVSYEILVHSEESQERRQRKKQGFFDKRVVESVSHLMNNINLYNQMSSKTNTQTHVVKLVKVKNLRSPRGISSERNNKTNSRLLVWNNGSHKKLGCHIGDTKWKKKVKWEHKFYTQQNQSSKMKVRTLEIKAQSLSLCLCPSLCVSLSLLICFGRVSLHSPWL